MAITAHPLTPALVFISLHGLCLLHIVDSVRVGEERRMLRGIQLIGRRTLLYLGSKPSPMFEQSEKGNPVTIPREFVQ